MIKKKPARKVYETDKEVWERYALAIYDYRLKTDLKQAELAKKWELNPTHFSDVLAGRKNLTIDMIEAAGKFGNINLNYVVMGIGDMYVELPVKVKKSA